MRYMIFTNAADALKNMTSAIVDYTIERPRYANDGTKPENYDGGIHQFGSYNKKTPRFVLSVENEPVGSVNNGFLLFDNEACKDRNDPTWELSTTKPGYTIRRMDDKELLDYVDLHGNVFFVLGGRPEDYPTVTKANSILNYFKYAYALDGVMYDCVTNDPLPDGNLWCLFSCFKMGELPFYITLLNTDFLGTYVLSSGFTFQNSGAYVMSLMRRNVKEGMFSPRITSNITAQVGKYLLYTGDNNFILEMFGLPDEHWDISGIKNSDIPDFNRHMTVRSNVPYAISSGGIVSLDLGLMNPGEMAYLIVSVDCGDFFNEYVASQHRMSYEYVIVKQ